MGFIGWLGDQVLVVGDIIAMYTVVDEEGEHV